MSARALVMAAAGSSTPAPVNTASPVASGSIAQGSTLSTTTGSWTNTPSSYAYQWQRDGSSIGGATGSSYTTTGSDAGANVRCVVTAVNSGGSTSANSNTIGPIVAVGSASYTTPGTYSWTVPAGVTSVCVVCVGAGAQGAGSIICGSGGALAYANSISVTPGGSVSVTVGSRVGVYDSSSVGNSSFSGHCIAGGGVYASTDAPGGAVTAGTGGAGGNSGTYSGGSGGNGAGGAGGYSGSGGRGGDSNVPGSSGSGGGGGGGGGAQSWHEVALAGGAGGGVGILGQGSSGSGGSTVTPTVNPATDGQPGSGGSSRNYGGGGNWTADYPSYGLWMAGPGAVRIIWGPGRSYPSNAA